MKSKVGESETDLLRLKKLNQIERNPRDVGPGEVEIGSYRSSSRDAPKEGIGLSVKHFFSF